MIGTGWKGFVAFVLALACSAAGHSYAAAAYSPKFMKCIFNAPPETGTAYRGSVSNDDYQFFAHIPEGLTGWSGVAPGAPYHGFTIFLQERPQACLDVEMHIRVEDDEAPVRPPSAKDVQLGSARGFQYVTHGEDEGVPFTNIHTVFTYKRGNGDEIDDGGITLIVPTSQLPKWKPLYEAFLRSVKYGKNDSG
jgi:hypothetical protein